jgi:diaminopimelate epimerase
VNEKGSGEEVRRAEPRLRFTKHHGVGNDFLVVLRPEGHSLGAAEVRALCDRHRGVGSDGLIVGLAGRDGADLEMRLTNADGSPAEMSGNGIRCLVQAAVASGMASPGTVVVDTGAGRRSVEYREVADGLGYGEVDMGRVLVSADLPLDQSPAVLAGAGKISRACAVSVGNPHVVLLAQGDGPDICVVGPLIESATDGGANIEVVGACDGSSIELEVWERGVGITESCGTGACAAAAAARSWGLTGDEVEVRSGGGALVVRLGEGGATLCGPTRMIGEFTVSAETLYGLVAERGDEVVAAL